MSSGMRPGFPESGSWGDKFSEIERRLAALESANRLTSASIGSGGLAIRDGGSIRLVDDNGDVVAELDRDGLDIGGGLVIVDELGLAVGTDVEIDSDGLKIDGILQPALAVLTGEDSANQALTTSLATVCEVVLSIPSWADEVSLVSFARLRASNNSGGNENIFNQLVNDVGGLGEITDEQVTVINGSSNASFLGLTTTVSSPGATVTCRQNASATDTGVSSEESRLEVIAIVRRTA